MTTVTRGRYDLVKGEFSPGEASEILHDLFSKKINFHEQQRCSQQIRFGKNDPQIDQRIEELQITQKLIAEAKRLKSRFV